MQNVHSHIREFSLIQGKPLRERILSMTEELTIYSKQRSSKLNNDHTYLPIKLGYKLYISLNPESIQLCRILYALRLAQLSVLLFPSLSFVILRFHVSWIKKKVEFPAR